MASEGPSHRTQSSVVAQDIAHNRSDAAIAAPVHRHPGAPSGRGARRPVRRETQAGAVIVAAPQVASDAGRPRRRPRGGRRQHHAHPAAAGTGAVHRRWRGRGSRDRGGRSRCGDRVRDARRPRLHIPMRIRHRPRDGARLPLHSTHSALRSAASSGMFRGSQHAMELHHLAWHPWRSNQRSTGSCSHMCHQHMLPQPNERAAQMCREQMNG